MDVDYVESMISSFGMKAQQRCAIHGGDIASGTDIVRGRASGSKA